MEIEVETELNIHNNESPEPLFGLVVLLIIVTTFKTRGV